jgi:hypothetical protein
MKVELVGLFDLGRRSGRTHDRGTCFCEYLGNALADTSPRAGDSRNLAV